MVSTFGAYQPTVIDRALSYLTARELFLLAVLAAELALVGLS